MTYRVSNQHHTKYRITEEGAKIIWVAYQSLFNNTQTMERREERGCIAYISEIKHWHKIGKLPKDFDWKKYIIVGEELGENCHRHGEQGIICRGVIKQYDKERGCSCHVGNPPCSSCTENNHYCPHCEWYANENY